MNSNASAATALGSGGVAAAAVVIISWLCSLFHLVMPADVATALVICLLAVVHGGWLRYGTDPITPTQNAAIEVVKADPAPKAAASAAEPATPIPVVAVGGAA